MLMQTDAVILFLFSHTRLTFSFQWPLLLCPGEGRAEAAYERVRSQRCGALRRAQKQLVRAGASLQPCTERMSSSCFLSFS